MACPQLNYFKGTMKRRQSRQTNSKKVSSAATNGNKNKVVVKVSSQDRCEHLKVLTEESSVASPNQSPMRGGAVYST